MSGAALLAWTPFLEPMPLDSVWFLLLLPLSLFTAIAYKAVRVPRRALFWRQALLFTLQIAFGIAGLFAAMLAFLTVVLPRIV